MLRTSYRPLLGVSFAGRGPYRETVLRMLDDSRQ